MIVSYSPCIEKVLTVEVRSRLSTYLYSRVEEMVPYQAHTLKIVGSSPTSGPNEEDIFK